MAKKFQRRRLTKQELSNIEAWYSLGYPYKKIAKKLGRSTQAIANIVRRIVKPGLYQNVGSTGKLSQIDFSGVTPQDFKEISSTGSIKLSVISDKKQPRQVAVKTRSEKDDLIKLIAALPTDAETKLKLFKSL